MENIVVLLLTLIVVVICSRLVLKKHNPLLVFFGAGIIIHFYLAIARGYTPLGEKTMGSIYLDIFGFITSEFKSQLGGVGSNLMMVAGYATLMTQIGASEKLATVATKPLRKINRPYLILAFLYFIGVVLKMMITSHAGLALLLFSTTYPILIELGVSKLSAASVILISGSLDWGPNDGAVLFAADNVTGIPVGEYFINYQLISAAATILTVGIVMAVYYKYLDKKMATTSGEVVLERTVENKEISKASQLPGVYAILPALPLLLIIGNLFVPSVKLDVFTANVFGILVTLLIESVRHKEDVLETLTDNLKVTFQAMGNSFANIVTLIVAASVFAKGLIELGGFNILADGLATFSGAKIFTIVAFTILSFVAVIILGSGNAGWFAFGPLVLDMARKVGLESYQIAVPIQLASGMGRGVSPVAAAVISIAGLTGIELEDLIKHNAVPIVAGLIANIVVSYVVYVL